ncbi:MAG: hypothetical protein KDD02_26835 [Phaeodactylibacter sp.]|nr:hypothetical protein [Phaeodactylibacter sp.]MCB9299666.1 hypothetical protein [Lewinellaceae bacterium]HQU59734.1 hypothetical protein [Saprospiraceae bacterium]
MDFLDLGERSVFFFLLLFVLSIVVGQCLAIGGLFFFKRSGDARANAFFGLLLLTFGLTLLHNILYFLKVYEQFPRLKFLPLYYTLAFPTLLFYHVKLSLYPSYHLRWTDVKHFLLPGLQFLFFVVLFLLPVEVKSQWDRNFYNPFYGAFEQLLYLSTFSAYLYFAHRYVRQRRLALSRPKLQPKELKKVLYERTLIRVLFVLFVIHAAFVVTDFVCYEFLNINLRAVKLYVALGMLSFAALAFWLGTYGFQVLLWGRRVFGSKNQSHADA